MGGGTKTDLASLGLLPYVTWFRTFWSGVRRWAHRGAYILLGYVALCVPVGVLGAHTEFLRSRALAGTHAVDYSRIVLSIAMTRWLQLTTSPPVVVGAGLVAYVATLLVVALGSAAWHWNFPLDSNAERQRAVEFVKVHQLFGPRIRRVGYATCATALLAGFLCGRLQHRLFSGMVLLLVPPVVIGAEWTLYYFHTRKSAPEVPIDCLVRTVLGPHRGSRLLGAWCGFTAGLAFIAWVVVPGLERLVRVTGVWCAQAVDALFGYSEHVKAVRRLAGSWPPRTVQALASYANPGLRSIGAGATSVDQIAKYLFVAGGEFCALSLLAITFIGPRLVGKNSKNSTLKETLVMVAKATLGVLLFEVLLWLLAPPGWVRSPLSLWAIVSMAISFVLRQHADRTASASERPGLADALPTAQVPAPAASPPRRKPDE